MTPDVYQAWWANDPWVWIGWLVFLGSSLSALVAIVLVIMLTEDSTARPDSRRRHLRS